MTLSNTQKAVLCVLLAVLIVSLTAASWGIAEALGAKLGPAISASESVDEYAPYSRNYVMARPKMALRSKTLISPGETSVSAQVKVIYSIR